MLFKSIAILNTGIRQKSKYVIISLTKEVLEFCNLLLKHGLISQIYILSSNRLIIYLKYYNNNNILFNIEMISRPGFKRGINLFKLKSYKLKNSYYLLRTNKGLFFSNEVIQYNISGELICKIN
jgi:ribosomal protein S8